MNITQYNTVQMQDTCFALLFTARLFKIFPHFLQRNKLIKTGTAVS